MPDLTQFSRRLRRLKTASAALFLGGTGFLLLDFLSKLPPAEKGVLATFGAVALAASGYLYFRSQELPQNELLALAQSHHGLLTLSEIATALAITPDLALRTLTHLQKTGIANPRWQELHKNLWEFPDYLPLPLAQTLDLAQANNGTLSLKSLLAQGHSLDTALQTFQTLTTKGLATEDPAPTTPQDRTLTLRSGLPN